MGILCATMPTSLGFPQGCKVWAVRSNDRIREHRYENNIEWSARTLPLTLANLVRLSLETPEYSSVPRGPDPTPALFGIRLEKWKRSSPRSPYGICTVVNELQSWLILLAEQGATVEESLLAVRTLSRISPARTCIHGFVW